MDRDSGRPVGGLLTGFGVRRMMAAVLRVGARRHNGKGPGIDDL